MNNSDMPANPTIYMPRKESGGCYKNDDTAITKYPGLTKRETFAMAAMQGILSSEYYSDFCNDARTHNKNVDGCAVMAIKHADALLKELEEK
jgi:hypothetical protein